MDIHTELARGLAKSLGMGSYFLKGVVLHLQPGEKRAFEAYNYGILLCPLALFSGNFLKVSSTRGTFSISDSSIKTNTLEHTGRVTMENISATESSTILALFIYPNTTKQDDHGAKL